MLDEHTFLFTKKAIYVEQMAFRIVFN